jgi:hypothetical protein
MNGDEELSSDKIEQMSREVTEFPIQIFISN